MKQIYFLLAVMLGVTFNAGAQNTVDIDDTAPLIGFMNVFETDCTSFVFNSGWGVADLKTTTDAGAGTVILQPNFNTYADNPTDPFWVDQATGEGNKCMEANTFVEDNSLVGSELTFEGSCTSYTLDGSYEVMAFIKVFNADFSVLKEETASLVEGETFTLVYDNVEAADAVVQYGFKVVGRNANPADEGTLGSVVIGPKVLSTNDFTVTEVSAFPNPTADKWNITANNEISTIELFDITGKQVTSIEVNSKTAAIEAGEFLTGMYFARVTSNAGQSTIRLIRR